MDLKEAPEFILAGRALLSTGAGFSRGAVNLRGDSFKAGGAFAANLANPFRLATNLAEFFDIFVAVLTPSNKQEIARAAKHILGRIEALPKERQDQRYVTIAGRLCFTCLNWHQQSRVD